MNSNTSSVNSTVAPVERSKDQEGAPAAASAVPAGPDLAEYWRGRWKRECAPLGEPTDAAIRQAMSGTEWLPIVEEAEAFDFVREMLRRFPSVAAPAVDPGVAQDAARLDWMEKHWFYRQGDGCLALAFNETWDAGDHPNLRAAIDAAMAVEPANKEPTR